MSHGINLRPDQKEIWFVDGVYGYVYAFDVTSLPPKHVADMPIFQRSFGDTEARLGVVQYRR